MEALAVVASKLASARPSPESARATLVASAPNFSTHSLRVRKFPVDFDIFSELSMRCPFALTDLGQYFSGKIAEWTYTQNERWFRMRSRPDERMSSGYQYVNSDRSASPCSLEMGALDGNGLSVRM